MKASCLEHLSQVFKLSRVMNFLLKVVPIAAMVLMISPVLHAESAFVRVNQLGYERGAQARAYLMSKVSESGAVFRVVGAKRETELAAPIGASLGTWGNFKVYALDFCLNESGLFNIQVSGPANATSPPFRVDAPDKLFSQAVANALHFYQNERDGADFIRTPLRTAAGHLNDKHAAVFISPGFDATICSSVTSCRREYPSTVPEAGGTPAII